MYLIPLKAITDLELLLLDYYYPSVCLYIAFIFKAFFLCFPEGGFMTYLYLYWIYVSLELAQSSKCHALL